MSAILRRTGVLVSSLLLLGSSACGREPAAAAANDGRAVAAASTPPHSGAASSAGPVPAAARRTAQWSGRYVYAFDGGRTTGGSAETVTYTLTLDAAGCRFEAEGFQTDETIVCTTRPSAGGIDVLFRSYGGGGTQDKYGNAVYGVGDPLFALSERGGELVTHWKGYPLPDDRPHAPGAYFHR